MVVADQHGVDFFHEHGDVIGVCVALVAVRAEELFGRRVVGEQVDVKFVFGIVFEEPVLRGGDRREEGGIGLVIGEHARERIVFLEPVVARLDLLRLFGKVVPRLRVRSAQRDGLLNAEGRIVAHQHLHADGFRLFQRVEDMFVGIVARGQGVFKPAVPHDLVVFHGGVIRVIRKNAVPGVRVGRQRPRRRAESLVRPVDGGIFRISADSVARQRFAAACHRKHAHRHDAGNRLHGKVLHFPFHFVLLIKKY